MGNRAKGIAKHNLGINVAYRAFIKLYAAMSIVHPYTNIKQTFGAYKWLMAGHQNERQNNRS